MDSNPKSEALRNQDPNPGKPRIVDPPWEELHENTLCCFIWLHDSASSGEAFYKQISKTITIPLFRKKFPGARHVLLTGPIHSNPGYDWYEHVVSHEPNANQWRAVANAIKFIDNIIDKEAGIVSRANVVLVGVGQGCAIGLYCLMQRRRPIGAFLGLGGWMPFLESIRSVADSNAREAGPRHPLPQVDNNTAISGPFNNDHHTSFSLQSYPNHTFDRSGGQSQETTSVADSTTIRDHSTPMRELSSSNHQASSQVQFKPGNTFSVSQQQFNQATIVGNNVPTAYNDTTTIDPVNSNYRTSICHQPNPIGTMNWTTLGQPQRADGQGFSSGAGILNLLPEPKHPNQTGLQDLKKPKAAEEQHQRGLLPKVQASGNKLEHFSGGLNHIQGRVEQRSSGNETRTVTEPERGPIANNESNSEPPSQSSKARRERVAYFLRQLCRSPAGPASFVEQTAVDTPVFLAYSRMDELLAYKKSELAHGWLKELGFKAELHPVASNKVNDRSLDELSNLMKTHGIGPWEM